MRHMLLFLSDVITCLCVQTCLKSTFFFKNVQATNQWGGLGLGGQADKREMMRGNKLWSWCWKVKYIAAVTSSDASFLLRTTDSVTSGFALFGRFLKWVQTSQSDAKMWLKPLQTAFLFSRSSLSSTLLMARSSFSRLMDHPAVKECLIQSTQVVE